MDKLTKSAIAARRAGLTYGQYMAMQPPYVKPEVPDGWKRCEYCGKGFKPVQGKRFCDVECRERAYKERGGKRTNGA